MNYCVYFLRAGNRGAIKIGISNNLERCIEVLQIGNPFKLNLLATIPCTSRNQALDLEKRIHKIFQRKRIRGEWFQSTINFKETLEIMKKNSLKMEQSKEEVA